MMIKPKTLKPGDRIGLVAPSSPVKKPEMVDLSIAKLQELGFEVKAGQSCYGNYGYLSGRDDIRSRDINEMFADKSIDGIFCIRGGYGSPRILDMLDYNLIGENPKIFAGYSDITALHIAFNQLCGFVTYHSPMASTDMLPVFDEFSNESFLRAISSVEPLGELQNPQGEEIGCLVKGKASGEITGGNLSLIAATIGTKYEIDTRGKLILIEDVDEEPYSIDRMLNQLRLAGKFQDCRGIILGDWNNCVPQGTSPSLTLMDIFNDLLVPAGKPTIYNFKAGHCSPCITVPLGAKAELDADEGRLVIVG
jgi:muramoyltetrapeptide carboxypeptidase